MDATTDPVTRWFIEQGFHLAYQTTAVTLLVHPDHPGLEVRIGTVLAIIERDGREIFRSPVREFAADEALRMLRRT